MKKFVTLLLFFGVGMSVRAADLKRGTIVLVYRLAEPTPDGFNMLIEAVADPNISNQRLFYLAEEQNNKILRRGVELIAYVVFDRGSKMASLVTDLSAPTVAAKLDVNRTGVGLLVGKMGDEAIDSQVSLARNCRQILIHNNY